MNSMAIMNEKAEFSALGSLSDWDKVVLEEQSVQASLAGPLILGFLTLAIGFGGFFYWAYSTPLAQASVAAGRVIVESNTKTVTHLEGGTLAFISVEEGQKVTQGQVLAGLDVTRSQSQLTRLSEQLFGNKVRLARLTAEKNGLAAFSYEGKLDNGVTTALSEQIIANEISVFAERGKLYADLIAVDRSGIEQLESQRAGHEARKSAWKEQLVLIRRDYEALSALAAQQLATMARANDKKVYLVELQLRIAEAELQLSENAQRKAQLELSLDNRKTEHFREIAELLQATQQEISRITQEEIYARDVVTKAEIRAPLSGIVANIKIRTPGSALVGGQPILDIVPANQPMIIEGRVRAADIDTLHVGERAEIKLSAFGSAEARPLIGEVTYVAPDSNMDEKTGEATYAFKARILESELKKQPNLFLYPGMSAEVYIISGSRSALAYLLGPVNKSFSKAFREQ